MKKIIFIETSDVATRYSALAVLSLGFEPLFIVGSAQYYQGDTFNQLMAFPYLECGDTMDVSALLNLIEALPKDSIEAIISLVETRVSIAVELAAALGVKGLDRTLAQLGGKEYVSSLIPEYSPVSTEINEASDFSMLARSRFSHCNKVIVKPVRGSGAAGYDEFCLADPEYSNKIRAHVQRFTQSLGTLDFIMQEYVDGELVSVEGYVVAGRCHFLGLSVRKKIANTESVNYFPASEYLNEEVAQRTTLAVEAIVQRSGLQQGYFHSEFKIGPSTAVLIDANFGRVAGAAISEQIALAYQCDPVVFFKHVIEVGCLQSQATLNVSSPIETISIFYGLPIQARLIDITFPQEWSLNHTRVLDTFTSVEPMGRDDWGWIALVSGRAQEVRQQMDGLRIVTDKGTYAPFYIEPPEQL
ncbi:ATP-grasp domain-containing protein [Pseudomonas syringae pv. syringae]|uniref:ATP-grasp domain-containing protein n=1 Tax=Pseudomonas syringae TaxID=317 RepID=UPI003A7121C0